MSELYLPPYLRAHQEKLKHLAPKGTPGTFKYRETLREIGWTDEGMEFTCIPDSVNPWDPEVLKAIWTFDPNVIPLWVRWKFKDNAGNGEVKVFGRHGIGRYVANPHSALVEFKCEMPTMPCQGVTFKKPNMIEMILMKNDKVGDLPGSFIPWTKDLYNFLRERWAERTPKELMKVVQDKLDAEAEASRKLQEEFEYRTRDLQHYATKKMEQAGELEMKNHFLRAGNRAEHKSKNPRIALDSTKVLGTTPTDSTIIVSE